MQHLLSAPVLSLWMILLVALAAPAMGAGAAWVSAKLAHGGRPGALLVISMAGAEVLLAASAAMARPEAIAWSLGLGWTLAILASVDLAAFRLPDVLTLPLMSAGLARAALSDDDLAGHVAGLVVGYSAIAVTGWIFKRLRGRRGIGLGDAKLFAAAGAWLGWAPLPSVMLIACGLGLAWFAVAALSEGRGALNARAPFGVALCCGTWVIWLLG